MSINELPERPDPPDPMLACDWKVVIDDPVHGPPHRVTLYYPTVDAIPARWRGKEKRLKVKGKKEKE